MEVVEKYDLNDPRLFRQYQKKQTIKSVPFFVIENALSKDEIEKIRSMLGVFDDTAIDTEQFKNNEHLKWIYVNCRDEEVDSKHNITRRCLDFKTYDDLIIQKCLSANKKIWNLDITGAITTKYLVYEVDKYSDWHTDGSFGIDVELDTSVVWRKLSATVALTEDYDGGEFEMILSANPHDSYIKVKPSLGSIVLFPPFINHRIAPVTRGVKKTLVYWFCGPRWK